MIVSADKRQLRRLRKNTFRLTFAEEHDCEGHVAWSAYAVYSDVIEGALLELPSTNLERKKGKWISTDDGWDGEYFACSKCGCQWMLIEGSPEENGMNFCPNCGAYMRGNEDEVD